MDAILILGAAVWRDGPSPTLLRRTRHAANLWIGGAAPVVIPCGGMGLHAPTEAAAMTKILHDAGVPASAIIPEDRSTSTLENIRFALPLLNALNARSIVIVTDAYHARRAAMVARHFGLIAHVSSPNSDRRHIKAQIREWAARPLYAARLRGIPRNG